MLYCADLSYQYSAFSAMQSDPAVKIHGALMHHISPVLSQRLHQPEYHPFSLYCLPTASDEFLLRTSVLTDSAAEIIDALCAMKQITLYGSPIPIRLLNVRTYAPVRYLDAADALSADTLSLSFLTPAVYRSGGKFHNPPLPEKYFYSVLCKLNAFEWLHLRYEDFLQVWEACDVLHYVLESTSHAVTGMEIPGMCGHMTIRIPKNHPHSSLLRTVLAYASYSGLGAKTSLGMGGFTVAPAEALS